MTTHSRPLGIMKPVGGGDPIPLKKEELIIGRRPTCDIRLDFSNISGRHCQLRYIKGTWHIRDLNSTNGTTVNGQRISSEHGVMPDDEVGVAGHFFTIDYDPIAPTSLIDANQILEEEISGMPSARQRSLMNLAGLEDDETEFEFGDDDRYASRPLFRSGSSPASNSSASAERPSRSQPAKEEKPSNPFSSPDEPESPALAASDEDFFKMIQGDLEDDGPLPGGRR